MEDRGTQIANKVGATNSQENNYGLVCQGIFNVFGTCYLSVTLQCILAMEATRRAFVRLPTPGSPQYSIPDDSMTALIYSLFLERRQTDNISVQNGEQGPYDRNVAAVVVEWMEKRFPGLILPLGYGEDTARTLYYILKIIIQEGYVTGLEEDLCGTYRSQVTCKTCGVRSDQVDDDIMVTFSVDKGEDFDLLDYLTEGNFEDKDMADNSTRFLTAHHLFNFTERISAIKAEITHNSAPSRSQQDSCDKVYDVRYRTTICSFPRTLILDLRDVCRWEGMMLHLEFLDLSQQMEPQRSSGAGNCKYKLVVVEAAVDNGEHSIKVCEPKWY